MPRSDLARSRAASYHRVSGPQLAPLAFSPRPLASHHSLRLSFDSGHRSRLAHCLFLGERCSGHLTGLRAATSRVITRTHLIAAALSLGLIRTRRIDLSAPQASDFSGPCAFSHCPGFSFPFHISFLLPCATLPHVYKASISRRMNSRESPDQSSHQRASRSDLLSRARTSTRSGRRQH